MYQVFFWIIFIQFFVFFTRGIAYEDKYLTQLVYKFIYNNEKLCGDPFYEADWLPAMGECIIECEPTQYICLVNISGSDVQKCRELNHECVMEVRKHLGWTTTYFKLSSVSISENNDFNNTSNRTLFIPIENSKKKTNLNLAKDKSINLAPPNKTKIVNDPTSYITKKIRKADIIDYISDFLKPTFELPSLLSNSSNKIEYDPITSFNISSLSNPLITQSQEIQITDQFYSPVNNSGKYIPKVIKNMRGEDYFHPQKIKVSEPKFDPTDRFVDSGHKFTKIETDKNTAAKMAHGILRSFTLSNSIEKYPEKMRSQPMMPSFRPPRVGELSNSGVRLGITPPPLPPLDVEYETATTENILTSSSTHLETRDLIQKPEIKKIKETVKINKKSRDSSLNCCEWALNGLCDRKWQKIRKMCPKSCGILTCEEIEGVRSCTRLINVDVEDCIQTIQLGRYFGLKNLSVEEKKNLISDLLIKKAIRKSRKKSGKNKMIKKRKLRRRI